MKTLRCVCALLALVSMFAVCSYAQAVNATLVGTVTDVTGAVVPGAKVTITETNTSVIHTAETNASGNYIFPNLPPGTYAVSIEAPGFKKETRPNVALQVDSTVRVDAQLQPGNVTETVEVSATTPLLQTDTATTAQKIDQTTLEDAPLISS